MTYALVLYLGWACPGGLLSGLIPAAARPVLCVPEPRQEAFPALRDALQRVRALGPQSRPKLLSCRGLRCRDVPLNWRTELENPKEDS